MKLMLLVLLILLVVAALPAWPYLIGANWSYYLRGIWSSFPGGSIGLLALAAIALLLIDRF